MSRETAVFNGIPAWLLADYLADLGGTPSPNGVITGDGWSAVLEADPRPPGALGLGRVTVTIDGPHAAEAMAELRVKARRGGG